jgi:hypothetical protein
MAAQISFQRDMQDPIRSKTEELVLSSSYILRLGEDEKLCSLFREVQTGLSIQRNVAHMR